MQGWIIPPDLPEQHRTKKRRSKALGKALYSPAFSQRPPLELIASVRGMRCRFLDISLPANPLKPRRTRPPWWPFKHVDRFSTWRILHGPTKTQRTTDRKENEDSDVKACGMWDLNKRKRGVIMEEMTGLFIEARRVNVSLSLLLFILATSVPWCRLQPEAQGMRSCRYDLQWVYFRPPTHFCIYSGIALSHDIPTCNS